MLKDGSPNQYKVGRHWVLYINPVWNSNYFFINYFYTARCLICKKNVVIKHLILRKISTLSTGLNSKIYQLCREVWKSPSLVKKCWLVKTCICHFESFNQVNYFMTKMQKMLFFPMWPAGQKELPTPDLDHHITCYDQKWSNAPLRNASLFCL